MFPTLINLPPYFLTSKSAVAVSDCVWQETLKAFLPKILFPVRLFPTPVLPIRSMLSSRLSSQAIVWNRETNTRRDYVSFTLRVKYSFIAHVFEYKHFSGVRYKMPAKESWRKERMTGSTLPANLFISLSHNISSHVQTSSGSKYMEQL